jgi:Enoyl-CoA hydratase/carnithine racemase
MSDRGGTKDVVDVELAPGVATIWLDRPRKLNAFAPAFWREFPDVVRTVSSRPDVRAIVVAARGRAFTAGLDLQEFGPANATGSLDPDPAPPSSPVAHRRALYRMIKRMQDAFTALAECPQPVIAAVHGYCIGAGVDLITACDIRYAAADAIFSVRETRLAMVADVGTLQRLPRIVEPGRLAELVYTGDDFDAETAREVGLVGRVFPDRETLHDAARDLARRIAANSPLAVQGAKAVLRAGEGRSVGEQLDYVALWNAAFLHSDDLTEAMTAYAQRREPHFEGR